MFLNATNMFVKSELDLFSSAPVQNSIESAAFVEFRPVSVLNSQVIEFVVPESSNYYDMSQTQLYVKVLVTDDSTGEPVTNKKTNAEGNVVDSDIQIMPVNNFLSSMFKHVGIELNGKIITTSSNNFPYKSYIESLLNFSTDAKMSHMASQLYHPEDEKDLVQPFNGTGFKFRKSFMKDGKIEVCGYISNELSNQDKLLLNNVNIRMKFYRNTSNFCLVASSLPTSTYTIEIQEAVLIMRRVKVSPSVSNAHALTLQRQLVAKYPVNRIEVKTYTLTTQCRQKNLENIFIGTLPKRVIFGLVSEESTTSILYNPFVFEDFGLESVALSSDTHTDIRIIKTDYSKNEYLQAYNSLFSGTGIHYKDRGNNITRDNYIKGNTLMGM